MISKNKLKFYMCFPVYGTLACLKILQTEYELYKQIKFEKLMVATLLPGLTMIAVSFITSIIAFHICNWIGIDGTLIEVFSAIIVGGFAMNLVFYKYYKKNFANDEQDSNNPNNDTQK